MEPPPGRRPVAFLIRIQRGKDGLRGQVVAVTTGAARLFRDLREAMSFIEEQVRDDAGGAIDDER